MIDDNSWHLDKKVPISLISAIFIQTAGFLWWGASLTFQVEENKKDVKTINLNIQSYRLESKERNEKTDTKFEKIMEKLIRLETILEGK